MKKTNTIFHKSDVKNPIFNEPVFVGDNLCIKYPVPKEAKAREKLILETPHLFPEINQDAFWGNKPLCNDFFTGREGILQTLIQAMQIDNRIVSIEDANTKGRAFALYGLGGVGKTQIASRYVDDLLTRNKNKKPAERQYALILWLEGNPLLMEQTIRKFARWLGLAFEVGFPIDQVASAVYGRLGRLSLPENYSYAHARVLLVLDNGDYNDLKSLLPSSEIAKQFDWLITSRGSQLDWRRYFSNSLLSREVPVFLEKEAIDYFKMALIDKIKHHPDSSNENFITLTGKLKSLPLALAQAVAYLNQHACEGETILSYINTLEKHFVALVDNTTEDNYHETILTTWFVTLEKISLRIPNAVELLLACAWLSDDFISYPLLNTYCNCNVTEQGLEVEEDIEVTALEVKKYIASLKDYSLIDKFRIAEEEENYIRVHQLVQQVLRSWLLNKFNSGNSEIQTLRKKYINESIFAKIIYSVFWCGRKTDSETMSQLLSKRRLIPHLKSVTYYAEFHNLPVTDEIMGPLYFQLSTLYSQSGDNRNAFNYAEKSFNFIQKDVEVSHEVKAESYSQLGLAYLSMGENERGISLLNQTLKIWEDCGNNREIINTLLNISTGLSDRGSKEKKISLLKRALKLCENFPHHEALAAILINLSTVHGIGGDYEEARRLLEKAKIIQEKQYGSNHIEMKEVLNSLGICYRRMEEPHEGIKILEHALSITESYYSNDHIEIASILMNLGLCYGDIGNNNKKKCFIKKALNIQISEYGEHPNIVDGLINLSNIYRNANNFDKAEKLLRRALVIQEKAYGKEHEEVKDVARYLETLSYRRNFYQKGLFDISLDDKIYPNSSSEMATEVQETIMRQFCHFSDIPKEGLQDIPLNINPIATSITIHSVCYWVLTFKNNKIDLNKFLAPLRQGKLTAIPQDKIPSALNCFITKEKAMDSLQQTMLVSITNGGPRKGVIITINLSQSQFTNLFKEGNKEKISPLVPINIIQEYDRDSIRETKQEEKCFIISPI